MTTPARRIAVAIPAHDEAGRIGACLDALVRQEAAGQFAVLVLANNCADKTANIARQLRGLSIRVIEHDFSPGEQSAGHARRLAMAEAARHAEIVLTTDADCVPDRDWVRCHREAFDNGVDAVAGRVSGDWEELRHHPAEALRIGALEWQYLGLIGEAEAVFDPQPHDPAPRHAQRCGANLGITRDMLDRIGGVPAVSVGEDRALIAAVERIDGRVRHAVGPHVTASARTDGRATGGMADALSGRQSPDYRCDAQFDRADTLVARWQARRAARVAWVSGAEVVVIEGDTVQLDRAARFFGATWEALERSRFERSSLRPDDLPAEVARLQERIARRG